MEAQCIFGLIGPLLNQLNNGIIYESDFLKDFKAIVFSHTMPKKSQ